MCCIKNDSILLVSVGEHSGPDFSKITTIHSNPQLIDAESERITKIIKGEVPHVHTWAGGRGLGRHALVQRAASCFRGGSILSCQETST